MLPTRLAKTVTTLRPCLFHHMKRNIGLTAVVSQKVALDPIQQLFIQKAKEYEQKKKAAGGALVDADPKVQAELNKDIEKVKKMFGADKEDLLAFPSFNFSAEHTADIFITDTSHETPEVFSIQQDEEEEYDENVPYYERFKKMIP